MRILYALLWVLCISIPWFRVSRKAALFEYIVEFACKTETDDQVD